MAASLFPGLCTSCYVNVAPRKATVNFVPGVQRYLKNSAAADSGLLSNGKLMI